MCSFQIVYESFSSAVVRLSGGNLRNSYRVDGVHFHWGIDDTEGSEHTIDGKKYPLEVGIGARALSNREAKLKSKPNHLERVCFESD